jgi:hypothetical protein
MASEPLAIYVNDHLTGSVLALELIDTLVEQEQGRPVAEKLRALRIDVEEDRETLRGILARIDSDEHKVKQAAAWLTEKLGRGRLALAARSHPSLALLEGLESLALGIQGKLALWYALAEVAPHEPRLAGYPYEALESRAILQHAAVERERLHAARAAFGAGAGAESAKA